MFLIGRPVIAGGLSLIDRKKNIFKLAQGEYVAPDKIEPLLAKSKWLAQLYLHGDGLQSFLVVIAVVNEDAIMAWAKHHLPKTAVTSLKDVCLAKETRDLVLQDLRHISKESGLKGFETPQNIHLLPTQWTPQDGLVTPTLKVKRKQMEEFYRKEIDALYREGISGVAEVPKAISAKL